MKIAITDSNPNRLKSTKKVVMSYYKEIVMKTSMEKIPIAKGKAETVKQAYMKYFSMYNVLPYSDEWRLAELED